MVRNSERCAISSHTAGTWCCQQPAPRKERFASQSSLRRSELEQVPLELGLRAQRRRQVERPPERCSAGICSNSSSIEPAPISASIACLQPAVELAIQGWALMPAEVASTRRAQERECEQQAAAGARAPIRKPAPAPIAGAAGEASCRSRSCPRRPTRATERLGQPALHDPRHDRVPDRHQRRLATPRRKRAAASVTGVPAAGDEQQGRTGWRRAGRPAAGARGPSGPAHGGEPAERAFPPASWRGRARQVAAAGVLQRGRDQQHAAPNMTPTSTVTNSSARRPG